MAIICVDLRGRIVKDNDQPTDKQAVKFAFYQTEFESFIEFANLTVFDTVFEFIESFKIADRPETIQDFVYKIPEDIRKMENVKEFLKDYATWRGNKK